MAIIITTTSLPNGVNGVAYSQTVQTTGGVAPLTFTVDSGALPTGLTIGAATGIISGTPSANGTFNFVIEVTDDDAATDTQAFTVSVYDALAITPQPSGGATSVYIESGGQQQFSATGGSGNYQWTVDGGNLINPLTGLLTAVNGGNFTVTVLDTVSGQVTTLPITITSQGQFCATATGVDLSAAGAEDTCCEFNVECGDRLQLRVPSFHVVENGVKQPVTYTNVAGAVTGDASALQSTAAGGGASGNAVSFERDAFFEIVTSFDMAQTGNGDFAIGWSDADLDQTPATIKHAVVWHTNTTRFVEVRHNGVAEAGSDFAIAQGDVVSFGRIGGELQLWINSVLVFTSDETLSVCGEAVLDISIEDAAKSIGGYVTNLTWSVLTAGTPGTVGSIDANGIYSAPSNPLGGLVRVLGTVNNANFYVNIRNIKPTPIFTKAQPFLSGRRAHIWVTNKRATDNDLIRIASDGSPDAIQNPGMIYLGVLEGSATFAEEIEYQDFNNDVGTYFTAVAAERGTLSGRFLEVRDLDKLALLMQHSTLHPSVKGVRELSVGGKACGACDLRVVLIIEATGCGGGWDVIYIPRAQNNGNLSFEIGSRTATGYDISFRLLPDVTRPAGKQLYSIYQMENCSDTEDATTCEVGV